MTIGATEDKSGLKVKDEYTQNPPINYNGYIYWSSEEGNANYAYRRGFGTTYTYGSNNYWNLKNTSYRRAVCISN